MFFGLPLAQAIGRWGNFFNRELVGKNGEPLFLYESMLDLMLFVILVFYTRTHLHFVKESPFSTPGEPSYPRTHLHFVKERPFFKPGTITGIYLIGYGAIRYFLEPMRPTEMIWRMAGYPVAQALALVAVVVGISAIFKASSKR